MKISIIQPLYLPWLGFFEMIAASDAYVAFDHVKFEPSSWQQRNRIKGPNGPFFITVPVRKTRKGLDRICDKEIEYGEPWVKKHMKSLELCYRKTPYFDRYFPGIRSLMENRFKYIAELNVELIRLLLGFIGIEKKVIRSSGLALGDDKDLGKNERLIHLMKVVGATSFYEGASGAEFIDRSRFVSEGMEVYFQAYDHPTYPQAHGEFVPYMSVVDLLFNCGEGALSIIKGGVATMDNLREHRVS